MLLLGHFSSAYLGKTRQDCLISGGTGLSSMVLKDGIDGT